MSRCLRLLTLLASGIALRMVERLEIHAEVPNKRTKSQMETQFQYQFDPQACENEYFDELDEVLDNANLQDESFPLKSSDVRDGCSWPGNSHCQRDRYNKYGLQFVWGIGVLCYSCKDTYFSLYAEPWSIFRNDLVSRFFFSHSASFVNNGATSELNPIFPARILMSTSGHIPRHELGVSKNWSEELMCDPSSTPPVLGIGAHNQALLQQYCKSGRRALCNSNTSTLRHVVAREMCIMYRSNFYFYAVDRGDGTLMPYLLVSPYNRSRLQAITGETMQELRPVMKRNKRHHTGHSFEHAEKANEKHQDLVSIGAQRGESLAQPSEVDRDGAQSGKASKYNKGKYEVDLPNGRSIFKVGASLPYLFRAWLSESVEIGMHWCFISAHNPQGVAQDYSENLRRESDLKAEAESMGWIFTTGRWIPAWTAPAEEGLLIKNIRSSDIVELLKKYDQYLVIEGDMAQNRKPTAFLHPSYAVHAGTSTETESDHAASKQDHGTRAVHETGERSSSATSQRSGIKVSNISSITSKKVLLFSDVEVSVAGKLFRGGQPVLDAIYTGCEYPADCTRRAAGTCDAFNLKPAWWEDPDRPTIPLMGPADVMIVVTQQYPGAYYHYLIDGLTRLTYIKEQYPELLEDPQTLIHTACQKNFCQEWMRLIGVPTQGGTDSRLVRGRWMVKRAVWPPSNDCFDPDAYALRGMQRTLVDFHAAMRIPQPVAKSPPIALVLKRTEKRVVLNHDEIVDKLREAGWEVEEFADDELPDALTQCLTFHRAQLVVGPHGAGLSNLVCARMGTPVVVFQQAQEIATDCYKNIAKALEMPFTGIPSTLTHTDNGTVDAGKVGMVATNIFQQLKLM